MNTAGTKIDDEPSRINEESSSLPIDSSVSTPAPEDSSTLRQAHDSNRTPNTPATSSDTAGQPTSSLSPANSSLPEMKRSAVKELIERYFFQLQRGCGNTECANENCASSGQVPSMTPNQIAARAIELFSQDARLCELESQPPKVARTKNDTPSTASSASSSASSAWVATPSNAESDNSSNDSNSGNSTITTGSRSSTISNSSSSYSVLQVVTPSEESEGDEPMAAAKSTAKAATTKVDGPAKMAPTQPPSPPPAVACSSSSTQFLNSIQNASDTPRDPSETTSFITPLVPPHIILNEQILDELIEESQQTDSYDRLNRVIDLVFSSMHKLSQSFSRCNPEITEIACGMAASKLHELLGKSPSALKKEDLRTLEGETDKDEDSTVGTDYEDEQRYETMDVSLASGASGEGTQQSKLQLFDGDTSVDLESLRRAKKKLFCECSPAVGEAITAAVSRLANGLKYRTESDSEKVLHCFVICFDLAANSFHSMGEQEYLSEALPKLCMAARYLSVAQQARLARIWATHCKEQLMSMVHSCQQLITVQVIMDEDDIQDNYDIFATTKVLKIAFYANILAGQLETKECATSNDAGAAGIHTNSTIDEDDVFSYTQVPKPHYPKIAEDKLEAALGVSCMDCRVPLLPFEEFYNEPLSEAIHMDRDYLAYKSLTLDPEEEDTHFSFMLYSFLLTPATKVVALYYDSRIRMYSERSSLLSILDYFGDHNEVNSRPDLKLKVRRDNIIDDALIGLEMVAMSNPKDLKKQLVVEFVGEEGIDEGGVSKEFFQLVVDKLFNPDYGMFTFQEETNTVWFNSSPFENEAQFTLIGIILGLAIYNNIILAVHFPMVVYRKLMGGRGTFFDLADWNPTLYRGLKSMLDYEEPDIEEVFMQTFKIRYQNVFGELIEHELKPDGGNITVGQDNKQEFVDLYSDFLLNKSVERQFKAFKKGFEMVTDESPLKLLFRPEEIELLVCGSRKFDFVELEESTEYEGGYTKNTQIIKDFWSVVHSMPEESKRKLLEFTTGSDRVPVGGLSRLKLLITRHGPDSERLPTSHTCFNVLLLPEYSSKKKLEERLMKAINYSKGFGML